MVKYFLVKVNKDWYATNKEALKEFGDKPVCVLKVNKLIQENQRLIEKLREKTLEYDKKNKLLEEAKAIRQEAKAILQEKNAILEEKKAISAKTRALLKKILKKIKYEKINYNSKN